MLIQTPEHHQTTQQNDPPEDPSSRNDEIVQELLREATRQTQEKPHGLEERSGADKPHIGGRELPFETFNEIKKELGLTQAELADLAQISLRTLSRRKKQGHFTSTESERLQRFRDLLETAQNVLEDEDSARKWLKSEVPALGGETPLHFAKHESGAREVFDLIGRIEYGVFS